MINGALTHRGTALEGLLPNSRMVQATFDDENFSTASNWRYPDTGTWDPERNLREFIAALPAYRNAGLLAVTISFQGGGPVANQFVTGQPWINSAFDSNGDLKSASLSRLDRAIRALDAQGMVAIVGLFYFGQANRLAGDAAIFNATDRATDWLLSQGYTNVLIEISNEAGNGYVQPILQPSQISNLIQRIKSRSGSRLLVSTSFLAGHVPPASVLQASDYVLLHGNDLSASALQSYIRSIKQLTTKPVIVNEDSTNLSNWDVAVSEGVSWGYYDQGANNYRDGFQSPPVNWEIKTPEKQLFFGRITSSSSPATGGTQAVLGFTLINADTDQPVGGYDPIAEGAVINLASLPTANLALRANTHPGVVGSVALQLDSAGSRLENMAPYAVCGDTGGDYSPCTLAVGNHSVAATPYSLPNGGGTAGPSKITRFEIRSTISPSASPIPTPSPTPSPTPQPGNTQAVLGFTLINADTDQPVGGYDPIAEGAVINLASLPTANLALRANTQPGVVGSVALQLDSAGSRLENMAPYAVCGDTGGDYSPCTLAVGNHSVAATPYSLPNGGGTAGPSKITRFEIRSTINPSASPIPTPSPIPQPGTMVFPGPNWEIATPESQNVDSALLQNALNYLASQMDISEAAVIRNGRVIWNGGNLNYRHTVWSTTKSFASTVLGLLIDDGKATLDTRASTRVPELVSRYNGVTLRHFTTMTSGYDAVGGSYDPVDGSYAWWIPETPMFAPGARFAYSDDAMNQFGYVMTKIAGENLSDLFRRRIANPIGMSNWNWEGLPLDNFFVNNTSGNFEGMQISASDAARFGHLFLNRGNWAGRQLLSASWVDQATTVGVPANVTDSGFRNIDGAGMYGFNWWVNGIKPNGQRKWPSAPPKTYASHGLNQNVITVFPEWNLVFVRQGTSAQANDAIWDTFYGKLGAAVR